MGALPDIIRSGDWRHRVLGGTEADETVLPDTGYEKKRDKKDGTGTGRLLDAYKGTMDFRFTHEDVMTYYHKCRKELRGASYDKRDIEDACIDIRDWNSRRAGVFLSAAIRELISNGMLKDDDIVMLKFRKGYRPEPSKMTAYDEIRLDYLGMCLPKCNIVVLGDAGNYLGYNARGAFIVVEGDASHSLGYEARGGSRIAVWGDAGFSVGDMSYDGEIFVKGHCMSVDDACKADVYRGVGEMSSNESHQKIVSDSSIMLSMITSSMNRQ